MNPGDQLHTFTILEVLGHGGMGGVFVGRNEETGELVAIKTLLEEYSNDEAYVRRFQREASVYRKLNHPNIVRCLASGFDKGIYFIAMEHIKGKPLDTIIREQGALGLDSSLRVMDALAGAVYHAHSRGVIHRDIKPQNIMIDDSGVVKLLDFGVAQADDDLVKTASGSILGTFFYSSPEQNQGQKIDERSDLYSMGLVFYEVLTGQRALNGSTLLEVSSLQLRGKIAPPSSIEASIPGRVDTLVLRLLERDPNLRYQSARDLQVDVRACLGEASTEGSAKNSKVGAEREIAAKWSQAKESFARRDLDKALELAI
jgi:serine/threonine-protein kinase